MSALPRRAMLAALLAAPAPAALLLAPRPAAGQIETQRAVAFIQATGNDLVGVLNSNAPVAQRRERVAAILRRAVDIEGVGRFVLGRWWRTATPAEQQDYLRLFEEMLVRNLASRFGEFQGVRFTIGRSQQRTEDDALVTTLVERPNTPPVSLDWRVAEVGGQPRIVDLVAEGASLRLTQRSEYSAVIQRNGNRVAALLDAMRAQNERAR
jgi:phospholipid transport system substrate-binding protein